MTVNFTLATKTKVDAFRDSASIGDKVLYSIDCTPWQEDNSAIVSVAWTNTSGNSAGISGQSFLNGIASAYLNFTAAGISIVKIVLTTATQTKTMWLKVRVVDRSRDAYVGSDYGFDS